MLHLHANLFVKPGVLDSGSSVTLRGVLLSTLAGSAGGPPELLSPLPVDFEAMQQRIAEIPRADIEPDGFFLITGGKHDTFWRLNGHMHEFDGRMHRVELNGECPSETLDAVLRAAGWPNEELVFQLVMEGVTLDEANFRKWAAA